MLTVNNDILDQLRYRRKRNGELMALQTRALVTELLRAESNYVESLIEYRERHGGLEGVILDERPLPPNDPSSATRPPGTP